MFYIYAGSVAAYKSLLCVWVPIIAAYLKRYWFIERDTGFQRIGKEIWINIKNPGNNQAFISASALSRLDLAFPPYFSRRM